MTEKQNIIQESNRPPGYLGTIVEASGSQDWEKANHGITWVSASFMLINAALGAVLLNTPELYHRLGGILSATSIQIVIILVMICTMYVMCACADLDDVDTYDEVLDYMCGRIVQKLSALSVMITCFGICVTFLVIIANQTDRVFATVWGPDFCQHWYLHRDFILILVSFLFIGPSSCARHLSNVLFANVTGVIAMVYVVLLAVYEYYRLDLIPGEIKAHPPDLKEIVSALPIMVFAYQTQVNLVPIYGSLRDRCLKNLMKSTALAMALLFILYVIIGSFGYLTFGGKVVSDVMKAYDPSDPIVALGVFAVLLKVIATYPQMIFCGRQSFDSFLSSDQSDQGICRRLVTSGIINLLILFLALITPNLTQLLQWLGSISSITSLVFPGICMATLATSQTATILWSRMFCIIMFIIGILVVFIGIAMFLLIFLNSSISLKENSLDILCQY